MHIVPESIRFTSYLAADGTFVEHCRALGHDGLMKEWDYATNNWKSWSAAK